MSNYQYKTAQNFTTATHANTVLGQLNNRNTASALCRYIPFHKKENCHSFLKPTGSYGGNTVHPCVTIHRHTHTHTHPTGIPLFTNTHALYKHTKAYTPSLGFVADSTFALKFLYFSLCHPEKHWLFKQK